MTNCGRLVDEVLTHDESPRRLVAVFDELSDELCKLADMADFVRMAHPSHEYRLAAETARIQISTLVETLNTDARIHNALKVCEGVCV